MEIAILLIVFFVLLFVGVPIAYALCISAAVYLVGFVEVPLIIVPQQLLKGVDSFTLLAIPFFIMAGNLMQGGGISTRIVDFAKKLIGHVTGGLGVVTVIASMIFAAMTGAGAATTAAVGGIMIPEMKKEGYDGGFASALQAIGGIFGPIIPPSVLMVLYAVASGESVSDMLIAGLLPGIFLGIVLIIGVVILCKKKGYTGSGSFSAKAAGKSFIKAFWALLAPVIILGGIYSGIFTPTEASAVTCFYCLIIGIFVYKEIKIKDVGKVVYSGVKSAAGIMLIVAATQVFGWAITRAGIPQDVATFFVTNVSSSGVFMACVVIVLLIAGCFLDAVPAVLIFAPIFCPTAEAYGINLIYFGVIMVIVLCVGLATPPVGMNLFVASSVGGVPVHKIVPHLPVLLAIIMVGVIVVILVPGMVTLLPNLMG